METLQTASPSSAGVTRKMNSSNAALHNLNIYSHNNILVDFIMIVTFSGKINILKIIFSKKKIITLEGIRGKCFFTPVLQLCMLCRSKTNLTIIYFFFPKLALCGWWKWVMKTNKTTSTVILLHLKNEKLSSIFSLNKSTVIKNWCWGLNDYVQFWQLVFMIFFPTFF